jgi:hypothetical protein
MKKETQKIQIIGENKKTKQAIIMIPLTLLPDIEELFNADTIDYQIALKRKNDPKRELVSLNQVKKELGL